MKPPRKPKLLTIRDAMNRLSTYTDLCGFTEIEDEAARVLSSEYKKHPLYLNGLTSLTPSAAEALAQHKGKRLHLNGIISLTSPAAAALSLYQGEELFLSSLHFTPAISAQLVGYKGNISVGNSSLGADLLETFRSHKGRISIDSVTHLTDEEATVLAELISQGKVILNIRKVREFTDSEGHQSLLREIVKKSSKKGTLFIDGAKQVSPQSLQILSEFDGADLKAEPDILKQLIKIKRRNVVRLIERGKLKEPREWKSGCIQLNAPPLKSLKGRDSARCDPTQSTWWLPERVLNWFLQNLDPTHKTRAWERNEKSKRVYISPEANQALRKNAVEWMWICGGQQADAKPHASALLTPENQPEVPREWQDESIVLPPPSAAVSQMYCWKPDFEGENYQAVLSYYSHLPEEHKDTIRDAQGYPAKVMSPEAAELYRKHRVFWETMHVSARARALSEKSTRGKRASEQVKQAAVTAGLSQKELEAKLDRLSDLAERGNLHLVSEMIAGFGDVWLYEALLAGSRVDESGKLHPGTQLKRFKQHAKTLMLLAVAFMPEDTARDASIERSRDLRVETTVENLDVLAGLRGLLPNLKPDGASGRVFCSNITHLSREACEFLIRAESISLYELKEIPEDSAQVLSGFAGDLELRGLRELNVAAAESLSRIQGSIDLGLEKLSVDVAECLAKHRGDISLTSPIAITPQVARALSAHSGQLKIRVKNKLTPEVARHLSRHQGPLSLSGIEKLDQEAAAALLDLRFKLELWNLRNFPDGDIGVKLCKKIVDGSEGELFLCLESLPPQCAEVLARSTINLDLSIDTWLDEALIHLGSHRGELKINPKVLSNTVGVSWMDRNLNDSIKLYGLETLSDSAAEALGAFTGEVDILVGDVFTMSPEAAGYLAKRRTLTIHRSKLKAAARKVFDTHGKWVDYTWTRTT